MFELLIALLRLFTSAISRITEQLLETCLVIGAGVEPNWAIARLVPSRNARSSWLEGEVRVSYRVVSSVRNYDGQTMRRQTLLPALSSHSLN